MNTIGDRNFIQPIKSDYISMLRDVTKTLPVKEEEPKQEIRNEEVDNNGLGDKQRESLVALVGYQSKVDQIDIYLRGSTNGEVEYDGVLPTVQTFNDMQNRMKISDVYA